jgi:hypothetical protein
MPNKPQSPAIDDTKQYAVEMLATVPNFSQAGVTLRKGTVILSGAILRSLQASEPEAVGSFSVIG